LAFHVFHAEKTARVPFHKPFNQFRAPTVKKESFNQFRDPHTVKKKKKRRRRRRSSKEG
jgi:hypothetical protein